MGLARPRVLAAPLVSTESANAISGQFPTSEAIAAFLQDRVNRLDHRIAVESGSMHFSLVA